MFAKLAVVLVGFAVLALFLLCFFNNVDHNSICVSKELWESESRFLKTISS